MLGQQANKWGKSGILTEDEEFDAFALLSTWYVKIIEFRENRSKTEPNLH